MQTPTEMEIQVYAARIFPDDESLRNSFIEGAWRTIYYLKTEK